KALRDATGAGMMDCKRALQETGGDIEQATEWLRQKGLARAAGRAGREAKEGRVESYIHFNARVGVLVEVNSETDFVANTDEFKQLAKDVALHIASANPRWLGRDDVPEDAIAAERRVVLKLSGDAFTPADPPYGISSASTAHLADQLVEVASMGVQMAVVVGGGNIWRGRQAPNMDRQRADYIGMLATVMNALALQD